MKHSKPIYYLDDDDLRYLSIDPESVTEEEFDAIAKVIKEDFDDSFTAKLMRAARKVLPKEKYD